MTALASTDVTVTVNPRDRDVGLGALVKNMGIAAISFGDGALTYPAGGVPLPGIGSFGLLRQMDIGILEQVPEDGYLYKYDRENHKIRIYCQGVTTGSTGASTSASGTFAVDENGDETAVRLYGAAVDSDYNFGALHEVGAGFAPAPATLKMLFVGE